MGQVYTNCLLALAAEDTADCALGFLPRVLPQHRATIPHSGHEERTMRAWSCGWGSESSVMALSTRGWTLQERILPSRTLRFTSSGMVWECNQEFTATDQAQAMDAWYLSSRAIRLATSGLKDTLTPIGLDNNVDESEDEQDVTRRNIPRFLASGSTKAIFYAWYSIVENYSSRSLTKPEDKLSALSGLASLLASSIPQGHDGYLAGIWKQDLVEGLLWHTEKSCTRSSTCIAPSWSWASMNGKVSYFRERNQFPFESHVAIQKSVCNKSLLDPTGSVYGGYIRLVGEVVPVHLLVLSHSSSSQRSYVSRYPGWGGHFGSAYKDQVVFVYPFGTPIKRHWEVLCDEKMPFTANCKLEARCEQDCSCNSRSESEPQFFCLSIGRMHQCANTFVDNVHRFRHWWLLLESVPLRKQIYKRVGIGYLHRGRPDLFDLAITQAITII